MTGLAFNLTARRQFYPALMSGSGNFTVTQVKYARMQYDRSDDDGAGFDLSRFAKGQDEHDSRFAGVGWYPGVLQNANPYGNRNPNSYWWNMWGWSTATRAARRIAWLQLVTAVAERLRDVHPVDTVQPTSLGLWKPYFPAQWHPDPRDFGQVLHRAPAVIARRVNCHGGAGNRS
jgi:hypothetical protein